MPRRPPGFGARVYTAATSWPRPTSSTSVGTAKSGVPMKTRRSGIRPSFDAGDRRLRVLFLGPLRRLGELLRDAVALELGDAVDEELAVEVVHLVLDAGGVEALGLLLVQLPVEIEIFDPHLGGALDVLVHVGDRQTSFLVDR